MRRFYSSEPSDSQVCSDFTKTNPVLEDNIKVDMRVTVGLPTKDRYDLLILTLEAIAFQTHRDMHIIIMDDSENPVELRNLPQYQAVFELFNAHGTTFELEYGRKQGQHFSHQRVQDKADTEWIWRVDDDQIPEPNVLHILLASTRSDIGAVGGLVLQPRSPECPDNVESLISDPNQNVQWFTHPTIKTLEVDHLHSTFLYRRGVEKYNLFLSPAAHREETLFSYGIKRKGFSVLVNTGAVTWHFPSRTGGIRSHVQHPEYWYQDDKLFEEQLNQWGVLGEQTKYIVLDSGRGDHVIVKSLLPKLKAKYPKIVAATCYRDIFDGEIEQISIAEAYNRLGNLDRFNVYRWCQEHNWQGELSQAYEKMWGL